MMNVTPNRNQWFFTMVVLVFMSGCDGGSEPHNPQLDNSNALVVEPKQVDIKGTIKLTFPTEHPENIAIRTPENEWYTIHEPAKGVLLVSAEEFNQTSSVNLDVAKLKGDKWVDGKKVTTTVFSTPGEYMIYMANNLETEPENTFFLSRNVILLKK